MSPSSDAVLYKKLAKAIENDELDQHYQPQYRYNHETDESSLIGFEALARWTHKDIDIYPDVFIPLAEQQGLIKNLGKRSLEVACSQMKTWVNQGHSGLTMAVNLAAAQLSDRHIVNTVFDTLEKTGLEASNLELEITESGVLDNETLVIEILTEFQNAGIKVALDDFGTGYSSLSVLKKLPIDKLKIDRAFVLDIDNDFKHELVSSIIMIAEKLGLNSLAEGVDSETQRKYIAECGCTLFQGYIYQPALPANSVIQILK